MGCFSFVLARGSGFLHFVKASHFVIPVKAFDFVIPASAGLTLSFSFSFRRSLRFRHSGGSRNPFAFSFVCGRFAKTDSRPCVVTSAILAAGHFLLLAQEKVTKEKGTLAVAVAGHPCPATAQARSGGLLTGHPWPAANARASCACPCGLFPPRACRGREGTRESKAKRICSALALGSLCDAAKGGRIRPARKRGCARGIARIPLQGRMPCQRNPGRP